jgi:hypothetical protein
MALNVTQQQEKLKEGVKHDEEKVEFHYFSHPALEEVAKVLMFGAVKYEAYNWEKGISYTRCFNAALRHIWSWMWGEKKDHETGLHHLAHAMCCIMFLLHYELNPNMYRHFDNRRKEHSNK